MKNVQTTFLVLFTVLLTMFQSNAQFLNLDEAKKIKSSQVIIGLTDNEEVNEAFRKAVKNFWTLTEIAEELPSEEAIKKVKKDGSVTVLMLGVDVSQRREDDGTFWGKVTEASGLYIGVNTKGEDNANLMQHIPDWSEAQLAFGLSSIEDMISSMIEGKVETNMKLRDTYAARGPEIKKLKLLINADFLDKGMDEATIKSLYPYPFSIVSGKEWSEAILEKREDVCYLNSAPVPVGDAIRFVSYVMSTTEAKTFAVFLNGVRSTSKKTFSALLKAIGK